MLSQNKLSDIETFDETSPLKKDLLKLSSNAEEIFQNHNYFNPFLALTSKPQKKNYV